MNNVCLPVCIFQLVQFVILGFVGKSVVSSSFSIPQNKLGQSFAGAFYLFSAVRKSTEGTVGLKTTSVTDNVIDWLLSNNIIDCASARLSYYFGDVKKWFIARNIKYGNEYHIYQKLFQSLEKKANNPEFENHCPKLFGKAHKKNSYELYPPLFTHNIEF